ncbi:malonate decarboxylase acyl carrier protein [Cryobacterium sp. AP23]
MQTLTFSYAASERLQRPVHVGAVSSGDLEIVMTPTPDSDTADILVRTSIDGFDSIWRHVLDRFFEQSAVLADYEINDFGATPGMVSLRLAQALELAREAGQR